MGTDNTFAYCNARIQARFAALPGEDEWRRLTGSRTLSGFVEEARGGPLGPWLKGVSAASDAHAIERSLRALFRDLVDELGAWVPGSWRGAVTWIAWVPVLPMLTELARGRRLPGWLGQDDDLQQLLDDCGEPDAAAIARAGLGDVVVAGEPLAVAGRWLAAWRQRYAHAGADTRRELDRLTSGIGAHLEGFHLADPEHAADLRLSLRRTLYLRFHQRPVHPVSVFIYLALVLLDLERLRSALVGRVLFGERERV